MLADSSLVFVYGSLKRGFPLHQHLAGANFIDDAKTASMYFLVNCGEYPGLRHATNQQPGVSIVGEIFQVDAKTLVLLDEVEGVCAGLYRREAVQLRGTHEHKHVWAWFYLSDGFDQQIVGDAWV
ncbi:MAG: gamma-glutamylcyclotransferase family protein [Fuerstiella sp.]